MTAAGLVLAACGGVPGNSVATVDGEPIEKTDYDHWNTVVRKLSPGIKPDDARNQALQVLVSFRWVDGEAERLGVKVSDADVRSPSPSRSSRPSRRKPTTRSSSRTRRRPRPTSSPACGSTCSARRSRSRWSRATDKVSDKAIADFYAKNKTRFAQPEKRDLRVVLTKSKREADKAHAALERGDAWTKVAKRYSIDDTSKATGGKLPAQAKGTLDADLDKAVFSAEQGRARRPGQDPVRLLRLHGHERHRRRRSRRSPRPRTTIKQTLASENQQKALDRVHHGVHQALAREDRVRRGLQDVRLLERAEADAHADADAAVAVCNNVRMYAAA